MPPEQRPVTRRKSISTLVQVRCEATWVSAILVALFFFYSFSPIGTRAVGTLRWFHVLAFSFIVFITNFGRFNLRAAVPFLLVTGLTTVGSFIVPIRTGFDDDVLNNSRGLVVALFSNLLILPALAGERCRRLVVLALLAASLFWAFRLNVLIAELGDAARTDLAGPGRDRNFICFILGIGVVIFLGAGLFWPPRRQWSRVMRPAALGGSLALLVVLPYTFSRSGIITSLVIILLGLFFYVLKNKVRAIALVLFLLVAMAGLARVIVPAVLTALPSWEIHFDRLLHWQTDDDMSVRRQLLEKGWEIVNANPLIGVGPGMSKGYRGVREGFLLHNGYLTAWAELGLAGVASCLVLVGYWVAEVRQKIRNREAWTCDLVCLLVGGQMLGMNLFLDFSSIYWYVATLVCAVVYDRRLSSYASWLSLPRARRAGRRTNPDASLPGTIRGCPRG